MEALAERSPMGIVLAGYTLPPICNSARAAIMLAERARIALRAGVAMPIAVLPAILASHANGAIAG